MRSIKKIINYLFDYKINIKYFKKDKITIYARTIVSAKILADVQYLILSIILVVMFTQKFVLLQKEV
jgi:hypothetical protein